MLDAARQHSHLAVWVHQELHPNRGSCEERNICLACREVALGYQPIFRHLRHLRVFGFPMIADQEGQTKILPLSSLWIICCLHLSSLISRNTLSTPLGGIWLRCEARERKNRYLRVCCLSCRGCPFWVLLSPPLVAWVLLTCSCTGTGSSCCCLFGLGRVKGRQAGNEDLFGFRAFGF